MNWTTFAKYKYCGQVACLFPISNISSSYGSVPSVSIINGPKAAKRYLLIKSGFFQDEVKKIGPPLFVDARLRENLF